MTLWSMTKSLLRALVSIFAPVILIAAGAALIGAGLSWNYKFLAWTGLALIGAGIFWGHIIFFYYTESDL